MTIVDMVDGVVLAREIAGTTYWAERVFFGAEDRVVETTNGFTGVQTARTLEGPEGARAGIMAVVESDPTRPAIYVQGRARDNLSKKIGPEVGVTVTVTPNGRTAEEIQEDIDARIGAWGTCSVRYSPGDKPVQIADRVFDGNRVFYGAEDITISTEHGNAVRTQRAFEGAEGAKAKMMKAVRNAPDQAAVYVQGRSRERLAGVGPEVGILQTVYRNGRDMATVTAEIEESMGRWGNRSVRYDPGKAPARAKFKVVKPSSGANGFAYSKAS